MLEPGVHCARDRRVHQLRPVKLDGFAALSQWPANDDPLGRVTVLKVYVCGTQEELIEADRGVTHVESRFTAVAIDNLRPRHSGAVTLECPVVLRPPL